MASNSAISLIEEEVLPICWEELNHKYVERRLLISELCCSITPYLSVIFLFFSNLELIPFIFNLINVKFCFYKVICY